MPIIKCDCKHKWQDKEYGKGMRLHNGCYRGLGNTLMGYRCTVCGDLKSA